MIEVSCSQCDWSLTVTQPQDAGRALLRHTEQNHQAVPSPLEWAEGKVKEVALRDTYSPRDALGKTQLPIVKGVTAMKEEK